LSDPVILYSGNKVERTRVIKYAIAAADGGIKNQGWLSDFRSPRRSKRDHG